MSPPRKPWFRLYVETFHDRKIRRLTPAHRWLWMAVLAAARQSPEPGLLLIDHDDPMTIDDLADLAALTSTDVTRGLRALGDLVSYDEGTSTWSVPKFKERQYESDVSTDRAARSRSRKRASNDDATLHHDRSNVTRETEDRETENRGTELPNDRRRLTPVPLPEGPSSVVASRLAARAVAESKGKSITYARGIERNYLTEDEHVDRMLDIVRSETRDGACDPVAAAIRFVGEDLAPFVRDVARRMNLHVPGD